MRSFFPPRSIYITTANYPLHMARLIAAALIVVVLITIVLVWRQSAGVEPYCNRISSGNLLGTIPIPITVSNGSMSDCGWKKITLQPGATDGKTGGGVEITAGSVYPDPTRTPPITPTESIPVEAGLSHADIGSRPDYMYFDGTDYTSCDYCPNSIVCPGCPAVVVTDTGVSFESGAESHGNSIGVDRFDPRRGLRKVFADAGQLFRSGEKMCGGRGKGSHVSFAGSNSAGGGTVPDTPWIVDDMSRAVGCRQCKLPSECRTTDILYRDVMGLSFDDTKMGNADKDPCVYVGLNGDTAQEQCGYW